MTNIAIFYHVGQMNHWKEIYCEQIARLESSGLLDAADMLFIGVNGDEPLPIVPKGAIVHRNENHVLEANTLEMMWKFCRDFPDYKVLYFHTKGVTRDGDWPDRPLKTVSTAWRRYMEYFCIDQWKRCISELDRHDTCGVQLRDKAAYNTLTPEEYVEYDVQFYDGNFWWANASYIRTLDRQYLYTSDGPWLRGKSETWIGSGKPNACSLFNFDYDNGYLSGLYPKEIYMKPMKNSKIVMICMFKNEAPVLKRMLESCLPYVDYYVMQNNGSTDGSDQIAKDFLSENGLSGEVYFCEEGWKGFGWNRDHLIRYCQQTDHGCDWILKMDCDEILEIDSDFDWTLIDDHNVPAFHIAAKSGSTIYYRCWMWNAKWQWGFNHDPCHETIYCLDPNIGEGFARVDLPRSFRQIGLNEGQSWMNPTKFVSDSLILEEKMIAEGNMLDFHKRYHFWYIGKSYFDAYPCSAFPLGRTHQEEYARRAIWYFNEWINHVYKDRAPGYDEMAYNAMIFSAEAQKFLGRWEEAATTYRQAEVFTPIRNDHLIGLADCYRHLKRYKDMQDVATRLMSPERTNPFPHSASFIDDEHYYDTGSVPSRLLAEATALVAQEDAKPVVPFIINQRPVHRKRLFVVDNFYADPDAVRNYALTQVEYEQDLRWYKGMRSKTVYRPEGTKEAFEHIIGQKIVDFESGYNGVFQLMMSPDPQVYHYDTQRWAAMIYLTPDAPLESGTRLHRSKRNGTRHRDEAFADDAFRGDFYDSTVFDISDSAANIYNRLVIMDAGCFHSAGPYFGNTMETGRLTHLFFFD